MTTDEPVLDQQGLEVLSTETCWQLLQDEPIGRIVFVAEGQPVALPVTFAVRDGDIVFSTAEGSKLHTALRKPGAKVAFEVDRYDRETRRGWSVLAKGTLHPVLEKTRSGRLDREGPEAWADAIERPQWLRVAVDDISGRRILHRADA